MNNILKFIQIRLGIKHFFHERGSGHSPLQSFLGKDPQTSRKLGGEPFRYIIFEVQANVPDMC